MINLGIIERVSRRKTQAQSPPISCHLDAYKRAVLFRIYILEEPEETVADEMGYTPRHIRRLKRELSECLK